MTTFKSDAKASKSPLLCDCDKSTGLSNQNPAGTQSRKPPIKRIYAHCHPKSRPHVSFYRDDSITICSEFWPTPSSMRRLLRAIRHWTYRPVWAGDMVGWVAILPEVRDAA